MHTIIAHMINVQRYIILLLLHMADIWITQHKTTETSTLAFDLLKWLKREGFFQSLNIHNSLADEDGF